jgi:transcriptional regulator with XRE-family HTH domain
MKVKVRDVGAFIRTQRQGAQISLRKLSKLAGVSLPYLSQIERGLRRPSAEILQAIAKGLRMSSQTLYVQAGILEEQPRADVQAAVMGDPGLTEGQKKVLLAVYHSLRDETERRRAARKGAAGKVADVASEDAMASPGPEPAVQSRNGSPVRPATSGRKRASGRAETQADSKPSPGSPSSSRSFTPKRSKGGAR